MRTKITLVFFFVILVAAACSPQAFPAQDPTAAPVEATFTPLPVSTPIVEITAPATPSLSQTLTLQSAPLEEKGDGPIYTITAQTPYLQGAEDPRVVAFNLVLSQLVQNEVTRFRADILANQPVVPIMAGSSFDVKYALIGQRGETWSLKFENMFYYDGAAHPGHYSMTVNYDLANGRELRLSELFLPGADYLKVVADYCKSELNARGIGFEMFQSGADALEENYQRWNLSDAGLVITFDEYQVAPYAAGPQTVTIPYAELQSIANPQSAISVFSQ